jgi:hypothetical protein
MKIGTIKHVKDTSPTSFSQIIELDNVLHAIQCTTMKKKGGLCGLIITQLKHTQDCPSCFGKEFQKVALATRGALFEWFADIDDDMVRGIIDLEGGGTLHIDIDIDKKDLFTLEKGQEMEVVKIDNDWIARRVQ